MDIITLPIHSLVILYIPTYIYAKTILLYQVWNQCLAPSLPKKNLMGQLPMFICNYVV